MSRLSLVLIVAAVACRASADEVTGIPAVVKKAIHDFVCSQLDNLPREKTVELVCRRVPLIPKSDCESAVEDEWQNQDLGCHGGKPLPPVPEIKKIIHDVLCSELNNATSESSFVAMVCEKVHDKFTKLPEAFCETAAHDEWNNKDQACHGQQPLPPIPEVKKIIHDLVCDELGNTSSEGDVVRSVCARIHRKLAKLPEAFCEIVARDEWKNRDQGCHGVKPLGPIREVKEIILDLTCHELLDTTVKERVIGSSCKLLNKVKIPEDVCSAAAEQEWADRVKACPHPPLGSQEVGFPIPSSLKKIIHDFFCKELGNATTEEKAVELVCSKIPLISKSSCVPAVKDAWANQAQMCHGGKPLPPIPEMKKIAHDLVCLELDNSSREGDVVASVCGKIRNRFPKLPEAFCTTLVKAEWDNTDYACHGEKPLGPIAEIKKIIRDMMCHELTDEATEDKVIGNTCRLAYDKLRFPTDVCAAGAKQEWTDRAKAVCGKGLEIVV